MISAKQFEVIMLKEVRDKGNVTITTSLAMLQAMKKMELKLNSKLREVD